MAHPPGPLSKRAPKAPPKPVEKKPWRTVLKLLLLAIGLGVALIGGANLWILWRGGQHVFYSSRTLPANRVGLVLGTSPYTRGGRANPFFAGRIAAAADLYKAGKVRHLLLSGDNSSRYYDEPSEMRAALLRRGVPWRAMTLDYAGFRTLDSLVRAKEIFGVESVTVITDDFHAPRAVFLGRHYGLNAVGFCSKRVPFMWSRKTRVREIASRVAACLDVYVLRTQPKFLGKRETIATR